MPAPAIDELHRLWRRLVRPAPDRSASVADRWLHRHRHADRTGQRAHRGAVHGDQEQEHHAVGDRVRQSGDRRPRRGCRTARRTGRYFKATNAATLQHDLQVDRRPDLAAEAHQMMRCSPRACRRDERGATLDRIRDRRAGDVPAAGRRVRRRAHAVHARRCCRASCRRPRATPRSKATTDRRPQAAIDAKVTQQVQGAGQQRDDHDHAPLLSHLHRAAAAQAETWTDTNGNGRCDARRTLSPTPTTTASGTPTAATTARAARRTRRSTP